MGSFAALFFSRSDQLSERSVKLKMLWVLIALHICVYGAALVYFWPVFRLEGFALGALLVSISVVDIQKFEIPDLFSLALGVSGVLLLVEEPGPDRINAVAAGIAFPSVLYLVGYLYMRARGQPGLGFGDVKLAAGLGLWLGVEGSVWTLLSASLSGLATLFAFATMRRISINDLSGSSVAFGPFLCLSAWVVWLSGANG